MRKNKTRGEDWKLHDIILSGGPPWGFTLSGGSEFGSILSVNEVSDEGKAIYGTLHSGDRILSVNGVSCTSRINAIQMVRTIDDELRLKVCRPDNGGSKTNISLEERGISESRHQSDQPHFVIDRTMNEVSKSLSNLKQNFVNSPACNYKIISINKDEKTNQHSIRIGIDDAILKRSNSVGASVGDYDDHDGVPGRMPFQINPTSPTFSTSPQQKVTVKMMPTSTGSKSTKPGNRHFSTEDSTLVCPGQNKDEESVDLESCQKVSTARAMFEHMSSSDRLRNAKEKSQLKSWNSSSLLDNCETDKTNLSATIKSTKAQHIHSKSLPVDISAKEYEKSMHGHHDGVPSTSITTNYKQNQENVNDNRSKSSVHCEDRNRNLHPDTLNGNNNINHNSNIYHRVSGSEIITSNRNTDLHEQMSSLPSYSSEDLRHYGKEENRTRTSTTGSKNSSANEHRQAASRYYEELMKNYPKFRNTITGKDNALKFSARKTSMPTEEPFMRGNKERSTIATTSMSSRSLSTNDTVEIRDLNDVLSKTSADSMMSRLLQSNPEALTRIDEEIKSSKYSNVSNVKVVIRRNSLDGSEPGTGDLDRRSSDKKQLKTDFLSKSATNVCKASDDPTDPESSEKCGGRRYTGSKSTGHVAPTIKSVQTRDTHTRSSSDSLNGDQVKMKQPTSRAINNNDVVEEELTRLSLNPTQQVPSSTNPKKDLKHSRSNEHESRIIGNTGLKSPIYSNVETDIDAVESPEIIHRKETSTDSAVYLIDDQITHEKSMSNVSTDSLQEYPDLSYTQYSEGEYLPNSSHNILAYYPGEDGNEKEKPQRTIKRKKKDSSLGGSRNNSCVSTDSTTSTGTNDSGIVVQSDSSQRASPMSNSSCDYNKDLNGSRETLDDDVAALADRNEDAKTAGYQLLGQSYGSSLTHSPTSSGENSPSLHSPRPADLDNEKAKLVGSMREKISELRDQEQEIADEIRTNEELGEKVLNMVQEKATQVEFSKFELFIGELNKIVALLLSLTQRLHRYELMLQDLDMANDADKAKKEGLIAKIDKLKSQHEEACYLRDVNDRRGDAVASFLENYCTEEEFADFQYYVDMKSQLALMQSEIREKVKLGEERLKALELTNSEWGYKS